MSENVIRILITDDHPVFRLGIRALLDVYEDFEVLGEAESGEEAVRLAETLQPDVILMDINLPGINGVEAAKRITTASPRINILIVSMFDDDTVFSAMKAGAKGYLLKGAQGDETVRAIRAVANGEVIFSPGIAEKMIFFFSKGHVQEKNTKQSFPELTKREREILTLLAQGLTNKAIADALVLSPKTIRNHVSNVYSKLQVASRSEAIIKARNAGLGDTQ